MQSLKVCARKFEFEINHSNWSKLKNAPKIELEHKMAITQKKWQQKFLRKVVGSEYATKFVYHFSTFLIEVIDIIFIHQLVKMRFFETQRAESTKLVLAFSPIISIIFGKAAEDFSSIDIEQFVSARLMKSFWVLVKSKSIRKWYA